MPGLLSFLSGPLKGVIDSVGKIIDNVTTTDAEKLEAQRKLVDLQYSFQAKLAEIETDWVKSQRDVIIAEAQGGSWLQRNWRPILMMFFAVIIGTVVWTGGWVNGHQLDKEFIMEILGIIKLGIGGYVVGRTIEKVAPSVSEMFTGNKKDGDTK
jgi:hypothetical protein